MASERRSYYFLLLVNIFIIRQCRSTDPHKIFLRTTTIDIRLRQSPLVYPPRINQSFPSGHLFLFNSFAAFDSRSDHPHKVGPFLFRDEPTQKSFSHCAERMLGYESSKSLIWHRALTKQFVVKLDAVEARKTDSYEMFEQKIGLLGCALGHYLPHDTYVVLAPSAGTANELKSIDGVVWVGDYRPEYKVAPEWEKILKNDNEIMPSVGRDEAGRVLVNVLIPHSGIVLDNFCALGDVISSILLGWDQELRSFLDNKREMNPAINTNISYERAGDDTVVVRVPILSLDFAIRWLSWQEWVTWISPAFLANLQNMYSSAIEQSGTLEEISSEGIFGTGRPVWSEGIFGDNQTIGVGDSGVDYFSCYFLDEQSPYPGENHRKIIAYRVLSGGDMLDSYGHGTHVAGSIAGKCMWSSKAAVLGRSKYNGMAPNAKLIVTDIGQGKNSYVTPPPDLSNYFQFAYDLGARIHCDSWTTSDASYNIMAYSIDKFAFENPLFVPVFAAGNAGSSHSTSVTVSSPAIAKNILSVGATLGAVGPGIQRSGRSLQAVFHINLNATDSKWDLHHRIHEFQLGVRFGEYWGPAELISTTPKDACSPITNADAIKGRIALVNKDSCTLLNKFLAIEAAGAVAAVVYNNDNTGFFALSQSFIGDTLTIPGGSITMAFGEFLDETLSDGKKVLVEVSSFSFAGEDRFDSMAPFSSWGPSMDGRLKPEIVAPGERIVSASSSMDRSMPTCEISERSGTSMSAPITAGGAALVRQYFMDGFYPTGSKVAGDRFEPSGALVKAVLINGAMPLHGVNGDGITIDAPPSNNQGYGRVDIVNSLFLAGYNLLHVLAKEGAPLKTGNGLQFCFYCTIQDLQNLKVTLVWHDAPATPAAASVLVNNLDLSLTDPIGRVHHGNGGLLPDNMNNVEQVVIESPMPGAYVAEVYANTVPVYVGEGQPFAFVARGKIFEVPCLQVVPISAPAGYINYTTIHITLKGFVGESIEWLCKLKSSVETMKAHDWRNCTLFTSNTNISSPYSGQRMPMQYEYITDGLPDANYTFSVQARNYRFNNIAVSPISSVKFIVDSIAPPTFINMSNTPLTAPHAQFLFSSNATDVAYFECKIGTDIISNSSQIFDVDWEICSSPVSYFDLPDGNYNFSVRAIDHAGNVDTHPPSISWVLHTKLPKAMILGSPSMVTNNSVCAFQFDLDFKNLSQGFPKWSCCLRNASAETCLFEPCSSPATYVLPSGSYIFNVRAVNEDGENGLSNQVAEARIIIDTVAPISEFLSVPPKVSTAQRAEFVYKSSEEVLQTCMFQKISGFDQMAHSLNWEICSSPKVQHFSGDGFYQFALQTIDLAGNAGPLLKYEFLVDALPPFISSFSVVHNESSITAYFIGEDEYPGSGILSYLCSLSDIAGQHVSIWFPCLSPLEMRSLFWGDYVFKVKAIDNAYNEGEAALFRFSVPRSSSIDLLDLVTNITSSCPNSYSSRKEAVFHFTGLHNTPNGTIFECINSVNGSEACSSPQRMNNLADGEYFFKVRMKNSLNSYGPWSGCSWLVDTQPPKTDILSNISTIGPSKSPTFLIIGYANGGSPITSYRCKIELFGFRNKKISHYINSTWSICRPRMSYEQLPNAFYRFSASSIDLAENVDNQPSEVLFLVNDWIILSNRFSNFSVYNSTASYQICDFLDLCTFEPSKYGHIVVSSSGAYILIFPRSTANSNYQFETKARAFYIDNKGALANDDVHQRILCAPGSDVLVFSPENLELDEYTVLMLAYSHSSSHESFPLIINGGNATTVGDCVILYTPDVQFSLASTWQVLTNEDVMIDSFYVSIKAKETGSYMFVEIQGILTDIVTTNGGKKKAITSVFVVVLMFVALQFLISYL